MRFTDKIRAKRRCVLHSMQNNRWQKKGFTWQRTVLCHVYFPTVFSHWMAYELTDCMRSFRFSMGRLLKFGWSMICHVAILLKSPALLLQYEYLEYFSNKSQSMFFSGAANLCWVRSLSTSSGCVIVFDKTTIMNEGFVYCYWVASMFFSQHFPIPIRIYQFPPPWIVLEGHAS